MMEILCKSSILPHNFQKWKLVSCTTAPPPGSSRSPPAHDASASALLIVDDHLARLTLQLEQILAAVVIASFSCGRGALFGKSEKERRPNQKTIESLIWPKYQGLAKQPRNTADSQGSDGKLSFMTWSSITLNLVRQSDKPAMNQSNAHRVAFPNSIHFDWNFPFQRASLSK